MTFQIKDFASIAASIINYAKATQTRLTDFTPGSVARTLLEAPAVELDELYLQIYGGLRDAIPVAVYEAFGFPRLPAQAASGTVLLTFEPQSSETVIGAGSVFTSSSTGLNFVSLADVTMAVGDSEARVRVVAATTGEGGNLPGGSVLAVSPSPAGLVLAQAESDFESGADDETDAQRKARFLAYLGTLPRGTVAALQYAVRNLATVTDSSGLVVERVMDASVVEPYELDVLQPRGWVKVFIDNGDNGASPSLLARARQIIEGYADADGTLVPGYKAAGVHVDVLAATQSALAVAGTVTVASGYAAAAVRAAAAVAISNYLRGLLIGAPAYRAEITAAAMGVDGVANFVLTAPAADVAGAVGVRIVPGSVTLA